MAGTIVADTIQNGAGTSTSMDNAIYGSAKAWVRFAGATGTIANSYNVSSVTRVSSGQYTVNYSTALPNANYAPLISVGDSGSTNVFFTVYANSNTTPTSPSTTQCAVKIVNSATTAVVDAGQVSFAVMSS